MNDTKFAYVTKVTNKQKKSNANDTYIQIVTEDLNVYLFTETELDRARQRAEKNPEDLSIKEFEYEIVKD